MGLGSTLVASKCHSLKFISPHLTKKAWGTGVAITAARLGPSLLKTGLQAGNLTAPFAKIVDKVVKDPWLRRLLDLECFVLR